MKKLTKKDQHISDKLLIDDANEILADEIVDIIAESLPGINVAYKLTKAFVGRGMKLRQQRVLEWVEHVRDNMGAFSRELCDLPEFQDCFVLLTEAYIKERAERKRLIHKKVLLYLTRKGKEELEKFALERMISVTTQISYEALNVLDLIHEHLIIKMEKDLKIELGHYSDRDGVEGVRLEEISRSRLLVSDYINTWISERYGMNSLEAKSRHGYTSESPVSLHHKISYEEHVKRNEFTIPLPELATLGILVKRDGSPTFGGTTGAGYSISSFGYQYLDYLYKD